MIRLAACISVFITMSGWAQVKPGLLWKISGTDLKKHCYLYGTMHISDPRIFEWTKATEKAFKKSKWVYTELKDEDFSNPNKLLTDLRMPDSLSIRNLLDSNSYIALQDLFTVEIGVPLTPFVNMPPLFILMIAGLEEVAPRSKPGTALDSYIYQRAKRNGKRVNGIETMEEQMAVFTDVPYPEQAEWLKDFILSGQNELSLPKEDSLTFYYLEGDLDGIWGYYLRNEGNTGIMKRLEDVLLLRRNETMTERSLQAFRDHGKTFVAAGALHLPGPDGLIARLRALGYTVEKL